MHHREILTDGVLLAIASTFPLTVLIAFIFRFPVPFVGYMSGPAAVIPALTGLAVYGGLLGGFILVGVAGGLAGLLATVMVDDAVHRVWLIRCLSVGSSLMILLLFSILDRIIGPW